MFYIGCNETTIERTVMHQVIEGKAVYVVEFDTMPELPITGLTDREEALQHLLYEAAYPHGPQATLVGLFTKDLPTIAQALTDALETGVITEPGKYGIHLVAGTTNYEIYKIVE
jgi:hypothetical protein